MAAADVLSAELAAKAHIEAVSRDYICEPRVGASPHPAPADALAKPSAAHPAPLLAPLLLLQST